MSVASRISPVLVGRDELLALGERRAGAAVAGRGHVLFLAGEAGIGKTRLLGALVRAAERQGLRPVSAETSPRDIELAGSSLLDLGDQLSRASVAAWHGIGTDLVELFADDQPVTEGDRHRARRLTIRSAVERIASLADTGPVIIGLEDLHWADDLTLEVIGQLARRLPEVPMLVVGTYRSDELYPRVPMREWRTHLLRQRLAEEARLPRLDATQTASMAALLLGGDLPPPTRLVEELHRRSDGIPLHVEELLGAMIEGTSGGRGTGAADPSLPDTLTDAILQRAELLTPSARRCAVAAAVIGRAFDLELLSAVHQHQPDEVGRAMAELEQRFFVVRTQPGWYEFRHSLIRDALEASLDPATARRLHRRVAEAVARRPEVGDDAFLSAHYELAGVADRAYLHARIASARAAALSSHLEALDLARRALRTRPADLPPREHAALLRAVAAEEAATDDNVAASDHLSEAREILARAGDRIAAAELLPHLVAARHLLGDGLDTRARLLADELQALDGPDGTAAGTRGRLLAALSAAYMLDRRLDQAIEHGQQALTVAEGEGDIPTTLNARATLGASLLLAGRMDDGYQMLEAAVAKARDDRREAEAARAYRMIGSASSVLVEYDRAERWLREGIEYAERTEQWNHRHYMAAHLAHVLWATGDWDRAERLAERALADGRGGITTTITALHVQGFVALGRGATAAARTALLEANRLGHEMRELQRFAPALWGLAETAMLNGQAAECAALCDEGLWASTDVQDAAYLFQFMVTGTRANLELGDIGTAERFMEDVAAGLRARSIPGTLPAIRHAEGLVALAAGRTGQARDALGEALEGWRSRRRMWEGSWAAIDLARCLHRSNRPADAAALVKEVAAFSERVESRPLAAAANDLARRLRAHHPKGEPWAPLSAREFAVARLIARGLTNREVAAELTISPKTVAAHVEHILGRLGAARRAEIAAWAATVEPGEGAPERS
jgi:predicted ATPase/DNA-binding CsgD family transcriptional regulator